MCKDSILLTYLNLIDWMKYLQIKLDAKYEGLLKFFFV